MPFIMYSHPRTTDLMPWPRLSHTQQPTISVAKDAVKTFSTQLVKQASIQLNHFRLKVCYAQQHFKKFCQHVWIIKMLPCWLLQLTSKVDKQEVRQRRQQKAQQCLVVRLQALNSSAILNCYYNFPLLCCVSVCVCAFECLWVTAVRHFGDCDGILTTRVLFARL